MGTLWNTYAFYVLYADIDDFDPTKHDAILHKPDPNAEKETVDTVVEAGYRIGDRVIRAARVVVASPQN